MKKQILKWIVSFIMLAVFILAFGLIKNIHRTDYMKEKLKKAKITTALNISTEFEENTITFIVTNRSRYYFKDLKVKCAFFTPSGTSLLDSEYTIYDYFYKNKRKKIENFTAKNIPSQTSKISCSAKDLTLLSENEAKELARERIKGML